MKATYTIYINPKWPKPVLVNSAVGYHTFKDSEAVLEMFARVDMGDEKITVVRNNHRTCELVYINMPPKYLTALLLGILPSKFLNTLRKLPT